MHRNKKIGLIYSYSAKNAGDLAITLGALDLLTTSHYNVTAISRYSPDDEEYKESLDYLKKRNPNVNIIPSPFILNRNTSKFSLFKQYLDGFFKITGLKSNKAFKNKIRSFDKVYFNGGNLLRCGSITDFIRLIALMYPLKIVINSKIPVIILPQSTAKINWLGRILLKPILNSSQQVFCREDMSYQTLKNYFPKAPIRLNTDLAFFIEHGISKNNFKTNKIAITTRSQVIGDLYELSDSKKQLIENQLINLTNEFLKNNYEICFVVQTKNDLAFTKKIYNNFTQNPKVSFYENYDPLELMKFYSTCDLLAGMRLHSVILALTVETPSIGYFEKSWGLKNPGILKEYKQNYKYLDDENINLLSLIKNQLTEDNLITNRKIIKKQITKFKKELLHEIKT